MGIEVVESMLRNYKNFILIGEAGSGKTEVALNLALHISKLGKPIHFFDMDQTKPLFRARDAEAALLQAGVTVHYQDQCMDAPTLVPGVASLLTNPDVYVIMDIGGGTYGSNMIGQFYSILNDKDSQILYLVNPYRLWSGNVDDISVTINKVAGAARINSVNLVANPNLGLDTTAEVILEGVRRIGEILQDFPVDFLCAQDSLCEELEDKVEMPILPIKIITTPEWAEGGYY